MYIRKAENNDHARIMEIYHIAQEYMIASGNPDQWGRRRPPTDLVREDIAVGRSYLICDETGVRGVFVMQTEEEIAYRAIEGQWLNEKPYITIHRIAGDGKVHGITAFALDYCRAICPNIRIDTHEKNLTMQHVLEKNGFKYCGIIYDDVDGTPRLAYQREN